MICSIMSPDFLLTASPSGMFGAELWAGLARALSADSGRYVKFRVPGLLFPTVWEGRVITFGFGVFAQTGDR